MLSCFSHVRLFATPWTEAHQAPLSIGSSRQEYWSGLPCPPPGDLPDPGIEPLSPMFLALAGRFFTANAICEAQCEVEATNIAELLRSCMSEHSTPFLLSEVL